jgi:hypothetical protein
MDRRGYKKPSEIQDRGFAKKSEEDIQGETVKEEKRQKPESRPIA